MIVGCCTTPLLPDELIYAFLHQQRKHTNQKWKKNSRFFSFIIYLLVNLLCEHQNYYQSASNTKSEKNSFLEWVTPTINSANWRRWNESVWSEESSEIKKIIDVRKDFPSSFAPCFVCVLIVGSKQTKVKYKIIESKKKNGKKIGNWVNTVQSKWFTSWL